MWSKFVSVAVYASSALMGTVQTAPKALPPSLQAAMESCSLNLQTSLAVDPSAPLQTGFYVIYNKAAGSDGLLTSFNADSPVVVWHGDVPPAFVT
ncbi:hypothetical protein C8R45DRAFT_1071546 [Mycena sanguinolenta]|nr:hypothetical protein C8R45DRAFT_1071546 [Mycena sanguinolenta]